MQLVINKDEAPESNREWLGHVVASYGRLMQYEANMVINDPFDAEDIVQDALVRLADKIDLLRSLNERKLVNYLITTVRNLAKNRIRSLSGIVQYSLDDEELRLSNTVTDGTSIEADILLKEKRADLSSVWKRLDDTSKSLLEMKYVLEYNDVDIAAAMMIKSSSVRMMLTRARRKALMMMQENDE